MRVSSKIIAGFLAVMLLAIIVVANELVAIRQLQAVNRDLGEINVNTATTILDMLKAGDLLTEDSRKYFAGLDALYERLMFNSRDDYLEDLGRLRQTARSEREQAQIAKCREALDDLLLVFNQIKQQNKTFDNDRLPPDLILTVNHFDKQSKVLMETVQDSINERVAAAADTGT